MADVFISYSGKSPNAAEQIADALERAGISCWIAKRNIKAGEDFATAINNAIKNCKVFLLVLDKNSSQSPHVANEVSLAFRRVNEGVVLVPFKTENCKISEGIDYYITRFNAMEGNPPDAQHIQALTRHIAALLGKKLSMENPKGQEKTNVKSGAVEISLKRFILQIILPMVCAVLGLLVTFYEDEIVSMWNSFLEWNENHHSTVEDVSNETNHIEWTLENGVLTISGNGAMEDYMYEHERVHDESITYTNVPWWDEKGSITSIIIESGVTSVGNYAFMSLDKVNIVTIPDSVASIGIYAFANCHNLTDVTIPDSVTVIEAFAFALCENLESVSVPAKAEIATSAFYDTKIVNVTRRES